jgi:OOP family OmpA-OmpF porin
MLVLLRYIVPVLFFEFEEPTTSPIEPSASAAVDTGVTVPSADRPARDRGDARWIDRWAPERNVVELGVFTGVYLPGERHELFEANETLPDQGFRGFDTAAPEIGGRVGYFPLRFLGLEAEGGAMPTNAGTQRATIWQVRGSLVAQLPRYSVVPFAGVGVGALGVSSERAAVGDDVDPSLHFGGGLKIYIQRHTALRLDLRDVVSHRRGLENGFENHNFEALLGFAITLGRKHESKLPEPEPEPEPERTPPPEPADTDADGVLDPNDKCVTVAGVPEYDGCPIPDTDGDGFLDPKDTCPQEPGVEPDGCPLRDTDEDGILDPDDKCVQEPESRNGFEDLDGCPDELPKEVQRFTGVIEGIYFDTGKATIRAKSRDKLDEAVEVLQKFPDVRVKITGHTDSKGGRDFNVDLSERRAESVKQYLVDRGVAADRIETRGAGPDEPIADNKKSSGRAKNRRIEFNVLPLVA